jgi:hypothetical protein
VRRSVLVLASCTAVLLGCLGEGGSDGETASAGLCEEASDEESCLKSAPSEGGEECAWMEISYLKFKDGGPECGTSEPAKAACLSVRSPDAECWHQYNTEDLGVAVMFTSCVLIETDGWASCSEPDAPLECICLGGFQDP